MTTSSDDFYELLESAKSDQPPLTDAELRQVRRLLDKERRTAWIKRQILTVTPWLIAVLGIIGGFFNWIIHNVRLVEASQIVR